MNALAAYLTALDVLQLVCLGAGILIGSGLTAAATALLRR